MNMTVHAASTPAAKSDAGAEVSPLERANVIVTPVDETIPPSSPAMA
jgi:hypothetical protein